MRHTLFDVPVDDLSRDELDERFVQALEGDALKIATPNPEMILHARRDEAFLHTLKQFDVLLADAVGLRYAIAALTDNYLQHRNTGVDTVEQLATFCTQKNVSLMLFGADPGIAQQAAKALQQQHPQLAISFLDPGPVPEHNGQLQVSDQVLEQIRRFAPTVLVVALGAGKQERFIQQFSDVLPSVKISIGVGGALDMISGVKKRAPEWMRRAALEFLWRLLIEPRRVGRIIRASIIFPLVVAMEATKQKRFKKACKRVIPEIFKQLFYDRAS